MPICTRAFTAALGLWGRKRARPLCDGGCGAAHPPLADAVEALTRGARERGLRVHALTYSLPPFWPEDGAPSSAAHQAGATLAVCASLREVLLEAHDLCSHRVRVVGAVALVDASLGRLDLRHDGAKVIVRVTGAPAAQLAGVQIGHVLAVTGRLRREQRRTFVEAESFEPVEAAAGEPGVPGGGALAVAAFPPRDAPDPIAPIRVQNNTTGFIGDAEAPSLADVQTPHAPSETDGNRAPPLPPSPVHTPFTLAPRPASSLPIASRLRSGEPPPADSRRPSYFCSPRGMPPAEASDALLSRLPLPLRVVIDCGYDALMGEAELKSLGTQVRQMG